MNTQRERREQLGLTQTGAARRAGVSIATWRRWEDNPGSVKGSTAERCEAVLGSRTEGELSMSASLIARSWPTPRQSAGILTGLDFWIDEIESWLNSPSEPLHEVGLFPLFDLRVMILVDGNRAWAAACRERLAALRGEITAGVFPFDRKGCFFDEAAMAPVLRVAQDYVTDLDYDWVAPRPPSSDWDITDEDWDIVSDAFDDEAYWDGWEIPSMHGHPALPRLTASFHPFRWFDEVLDPRDTFELVENKISNG